MSPYEFGLTLGLVAGFIFGFSAAMVIKLNRIVAGD